MSRLVDMEALLERGEVVVEQGPFDEMPIAKAVRARHLPTQISVIAAGREHSDAAKRERALAGLARALAALAD